ncbi:hypothetical protein J1614_004107 [Plenodomus biglobosus]|nr:hypothetical protein J1614_004107 [Plenodomus biglobosus]
MADPQDTSQPNTEQSAWMKKYPAGITFADILGRESRSNGGIGCLFQGPKIQCMWFQYREAVTWQLQDCFPCRFREDIPWNPTGGRILACSMLSCFYNPEMCDSITSLADILLCRLS